MFVILVGDTDCGLKLADLQAEFDTAVRLKTAFWDMGWRPDLSPGTVA